MSSQGIRLTKLIGIQKEGQLGNITQKSVVNIHHGPLTSWFNFDLLYLPYLCKHSFHVQ